MQRIAKFEKVSLAQFTYDAQRLFPASSPDAIQKAWEALTLPVRATAGSAGYDFRLPFAVEAAAGQSVIIPRRLGVAAVSAQLTGLSAPHAPGQYGRGHRRGLSWRG